MLGMSAGYADRAATCLEESNGALPHDRGCAAQAAHAAPSAGRRAVLRGADGGGGFLQRLLAALPPRAALGHRRRATLGPARAEDPRQLPAEAPAPEAA